MNTRDPRRNAGQPELVVPDRGAWSVNHERHVRTGTVALYCPACGTWPPLDPDPRYGGGMELTPVQPAPVRARYEFALATFAAVIVIVAIVLALATSRGAPAPSDAPDAQGLRGMPHERDAGSRFGGNASAPTRHDGGVPSSPAALSGSASEGSSDLTTSMPATNPEYANRQSSGRVAPARDRMSEPHASVDGGSSPPSGSINAVTRQGVITHNDDATSRSYLALPCQRNGVHCRLLVRICGPADCVELRQTDYGPSQRLHPDRIADVHPATFERICGCPASRGVTVGTWTAITHIPLPETDTGGAP